MIPSVENWLKTLDNTLKFWSPTLSFGCTGDQLVATFHAGEINADGGKKANKWKNMWLKKPDICIARYSSSSFKASIKHMAQS